jgi:hypothetical protein
MTDTLRSLDEIATGYTYFEPDQVLTPRQLNSVSEYLGDQERLTRVALLGVGIACGLWASLDGNEVVLSHGVGTTTDGDLVFLPEETRYNAYKVYDRSAPVYGPFRDGEDVILAYELVRKGESDSRARKLGEFDANEPPELKGMAAVLYVESYRRDDDLCTGTDCDNRGQEWVHTLKLLLVEREMAAALARSLDTPDSAARALSPVVIARAIPKGALATETALASVFRAACAKIHDDLVRQLPNVWPVCKFFLGDLSPDNPAERWRKALEKIRGEAKDRGIQYYYDFLKDVAETYNAFRDALFGDIAVCCPDLAAFPKHLMLGALDRGEASRRERTGFYPSPMVSEAFERRSRARFLINKLDILIANYIASPTAPEIRITPSAFEDRPLEERAIPVYYHAMPTYPVWSYSLARRGMERYNYSYNADRYGGQGPARRPLEAQIGAFDFFRIEGHIGLGKDKALRDLDGLISEFNLPIALEVLRLDKPPKGWRPPRFHELYPLRHLLRTDVTLQLADASKYGANFLAQVKDAAGKTITDADNDDQPLVGTAQAKTERMGVHIQNAMGKLAGDDYDPASGWLDDVNKAAEAAADMKVAFSPVTKGEFVSPLDHLITAQPARWLNWVDAIITDGEEKDAVSAQLSEFIREHPGLEHAAGVLRGGTFVLVCDAANTVIADFMLPYNCCRPRAQPARPPVLPIPSRPEVVFEKPIRLVPFPDKFRFEKFRDDFLVNIKKDFDLQKQYFEGLKDTVGIFYGAGTKAGNVGVTPGTVNTYPGTFPAAGGFTLPGGGYTDEVLYMHAADTSWKAQKVDAIRRQLMNPQLEQGKRTELESQLDTAETELAGAIILVTEYVAGQNLDVKAGTEGAAALSVAVQGLDKVSNIDALAKVEKELTTAGSKAAPDVQVAIKGMLGKRMI